MNTNNRDFTIAVTTSFQKMSDLLKAQGHTGSMIFSPCLITNRTAGTVIVTGKDGNSAPGSDVGRNIATTLEFQYPLLNADQTWIKSSSAGSVDLTGYPTT